MLVGYHYILESSSCNTCKGNNANGISLEAVWLLKKCIYRNDIAYHAADGISAIKSFITLRIALFQNSNKFEHKNVCMCALGNFLDIQKQLDLKQIVVYFLNLKLFPCEYM